MPSATFDRTHKRFAPSRTDSVTSCSTAVSSSSTLAYPPDNWWQKSSQPEPKKPWAIKALSHIKRSRKKSKVTEKDRKDIGVKIVQEDADDFYTHSCNAAFGNIRVAPLVLDISKEAVEKTKRLMAHEAERSSELLPECLPQIRRSPSSNLLLHRKPQQSSDGGKRNPIRDGTRFNAMKSTPNLREKSKRDSRCSSEADDDPFYLESFLTQFPSPPVHEPGAYKPREPVNPRVCRRDSNFSMPTSRAYPERAKLHPRAVVGRVPKGTVKLLPMPSVV